MVPVACWGEKPELSDLKGDEEEVAIVITVINVLRIFSVKNVEI